VEKKKWTMLGGEVVGEGEFESGGRLLLNVVVERRRLILLVRVNLIWCFLLLLDGRSLGYCCWKGGWP
jgi:hypothetical protein